MFGREKKPPEIIATPDGFSVGGISVSWSSITSIKAYKLDLLTYELICFAIEVEGFDRYIQLSEEWPGFKPVSDEFESRFAFPAGWWDSVAQPAFKANETVLFQRA
jgi:hypothetical protein